MTKFQIIVLAIFVVFIIVGVAAFATYKGNDVATKIPAVTVWGTFPAAVFDQYVAKINNTLSQTITVQYSEKRSENFSREFVAALARGQGPDVILITADMILPHGDKLALIPFESLPQRTFLDSYIQEAQIYVSNNGIMALPFSVDPLIMFWNRDMFDAAGIATYPRYWDEFEAINKKLTVRDQNGNVRRSAIAMGEFSNIENARELLGTLFLQLGNPVTTQANGEFAQSTLKISSSIDPTPAIQFFTQFSNPSHPNYSWNRGMPASKPAFLSGTLATYFGFASELRDIREKNPNLNFDAALLPQPRSGGMKATYGKMYGLSLVRSSPNLNAAYQIISILTAPANLADLSASLYLPTVRRDAIAGGANDPYISIFNQAALVSRTWLDADPLQSRQIFANLIEAVTSGRSTISGALQDAGDQYDIVLRQAMQ